MTNQQILEGNWADIKGKLRKKWGQLTDKDFPQLRGDTEQIIGNIQRKTGEEREAIEQYLQEISGHAATTMGAVAATARDYARHASDSVQHVAGQATDQLRTGYKKTARFVADRPAESLLVCLGVGLLAGVAITLSLRSR